ncbi:MAG: sulfotransferase [Planctomycetota bacterium]|nr:sulfotransferase [Planctomycetota bacterium]
MQPIFLFSLPRAGSTLAQRILGAHQEIATATEPWLLLPFLYALKEHGAYAEYNHAAAALALKDFCARLPQGQDDYRQELRQLALRLYEKAARRPARYFLDKTPRYHLVVEEVIALFPDAKHVFLWRNPLAVVASVIETFGRGKWNLYEFKVDLFDGLENLLAAYGQCKDRAYALRYEDLVADGPTALKGLLAYLDLPYDGELLESFAKVDLHGRLGDYTGAKQYTQLTTEPLDKWKTVLRNPLRRRWARRYLRWIGPERLALMGYSLEQLLGDLDRIPCSARRLCSDMWRIAYGVPYQLLEPQLIKGKLRLLRQWHKVHPYY